MTYSFLLVLFSKLSSIGFVFFSCLRTWTLVDHIRHVNLHLQTPADLIQQLFEFLLKVVVFAESISCLCSSSRGRVGILPSVPKV